MKKFPMLNTFRFFAALGVVIQHTEEIKSHAGLDHIYHYYSVKNLGGICVSAFFVLSGFLITYLLLKEKNEFGKIDIKKFYKKRVLRIWPLYFITLFLYKGLLPLLNIESLSYIHTNSDFSFGTLQPLLEINTFIEWTFLLLLLPHILLALGKVFYPLHIWSIGVEETFYLFWPWIIHKCQNYRKIFFRILFLYLLLYTASFILWIFLIKIENNAAKYLQSTTFFLYCQRISCMAIGALGAEILLNQRDHILQKIRHPFLQMIIPMLIIVLLYKGVFFPLFMTEIYSLLFICLILQMINWGKYHQLSKTFQPTEQLGKISYGIYMYHPLGIILTLSIFNRFPINIPYNNYLIFYPILCLITFGISWISFYYIEQPIQQIKNPNFPFFKHLFRVTKKS